MSPHTDPFRAFADHGCVEVLHHLAAPNLVAAPGVARSSPLRQHRVRPGSEARGAAPAVLLKSHEAQDPREPERLRAAARSGRDAPPNPPPTLPEASLRARTAQLAQSNPLAPARE